MFNLLNSSIINWLGRYLPQLIIAFSKSGLFIILEKQIIKAELLEIPALQWIITSSKSWFITNWYNLFAMSVLNKVNLSLYLSIMTASLISSKYSSKTAWKLFRYLTL